MKIADVRGWGKAVVGVMQMFSTLLEAETLRFGSRNFAFYAF